MMNRIFISFILVLSTASVAQADNHVKITEQQAGSSYSQNTEDTFKNEIGNCEDPGVLMSVSYTHLTLPTICSV